MATRELATIAKAVEKSKNIKGDIVRDLWTAYAKLSAALSSVVTRASDGELAADGGQWDERSRAWAEEKRKLNQELVLLPSRNTILKREREKGRDQPPAVRRRQCGMGCRLLNGSRSCSGRA